MADTVSKFIMSNALQSGMKQSTPLVVIVLFAITTVWVASAATDANIEVIDVTPTDLSPGDIKEVTLTVKNQGGRDARHITLNFQSSDEIALIGTSTVYISSINAWCSKEQTITIKAKGELADDFALRRKKECANDSKNP
jgi:hypothetical protein